MGVPWWLLAIGIALGAYVSVVVVLVALGRWADAALLVRFVPDCVVLCGRLLRDPRVPRYAKVLLLLVAAYLAMPFDLIPDVIPVAGTLDDVVLVALVLRVVVRACGEALLHEHWPGPQRSLALVLRLGA